MTREEALIRVKTGNFNSGHGFDMQLLVDAVGTIGEMFRNGQISEIIRCKDCKYWHDPIRCQLDSEGLKNPDDWFCADGEMRDSYD